MTEMLLDALDAMGEWLVAHGLGGWDAPYGRFQLNGRGAALALVAWAVLAWVVLRPIGGLA